MESGGPGGTYGWMDCTKGGRKAVNFKFFSFFFLFFSDIYLSIFLLLSTPKSCQ